MTQTNFLVRPLDPLVCRDSRPFGQGGGTRIRSLDWPTCSLVCGTLRTFVGKVAGEFIPEELKKIKIRGPFMESDGKLYFQRPLDFVTDKDFKDPKQGESLEGYSIRPLDEADEMQDCVTEMPFGLKPAFVQGAFKDDFKPTTPPAFWSLDAMCRWLGVDKDFKLKRSEGMDAPEKDERIHVSIDSETGGAKDDFLYSTIGLDFKLKYKKNLDSGEVKETLLSHQIKLALEAEVDGGQYAECLGKISGLHTMGGERRLTEWSKGESVLLKVPESLKKIVQNKANKRLRMVLATPAIFLKGWLPGWIDEETKEGTVPDTNLKVRLVSAVTGRWTPISGWSYENGKHGAKALRRMVPAGSVYFFEFVEPLDERFNLDNIWLRSVCDDEQDRNDGFGAALWGTW